MTMRDDPASVEELRPAFGKEDPHVHLQVAPSATAAKPPWDWARWLVIGLVLTGIALFATAFFKSWWSFWLYAPQYPGGLRLQISLTGMGGDVHEIDLLNHYIGMSHLADAAAFERHIAGYGVAAICVLTAALFVGSGRKLNKLVALPAFGLPFVFLADSFYWLYSFGHKLDPHAPLHIAAFTPQLFGNGKIGQFETYAEPAAGFWLAIGGLACVVAATFVRTRVCKNCNKAETCSATCPRLLVLPERHGTGVASADAAARSGVTRSGHALVVIVALSAGALPLNRASADVPSARATGAGPRDRDVPEGAVVAASFEELVSLVGDPRGPAEIWLRGNYHGDLVVKRPLALRGARGATLDGSGSSTVITIDANDVTVEHLVVRHSGRRRTTEDAAIKATGDRVHLTDLRIEDTLFGVSLLACRNCVLERTVVNGFDAAVELPGDGIKLWESHGSIVRGCVVDHVRDVVVWYTRGALLEDNVVRGSRYGTHFMYAHDAIVRRSHVEGNVVGIFVMYSKRVTVESNTLAGARGAAGMGVGFKDCDAARIHGNWIVANTTGAYLDAPRTPDEAVVFEDNVFALNDVALRLHGADKGVGLRGNDFRENAVTIEIDGGGDALACDVRGNHFSDYEGYDLNGDGIGDVPYRVNAISSDLAEAHPALKLFQGTVAMQAIDAIAHAVPVLDGKTLLLDPAPLVRAPQVVRP